LPDRRRERVGNEEGSGRVWMGDDSVLVHTVDRLMEQRIPAMPGLPELR
jgi:hypothetical protein